MGQRASQVGEELRKILSMILLQDITDPKIGFVTITRVELTDDLRFAKVYYSVLGDEAQKQESEEALREHKGEIKKLAIERINMKFAMELKWILDRSIDYSFEIDKIIKKIHENDEK
jgi:ribosome-binding factor A